MRWLLDDPRLVRNQKIWKLFGLNYNVFGASWLEGLLHFKLILSRFHLRLKTAIKLCGGSDMYFAWLQSLPLWIFEDPVSIALDL